MDNLVTSKPLDSSNEELNDDCTDNEVVNVDHVPPQRPHFLDYDAAPPPEYEENSDTEQSSLAYNSCSPVDNYKYVKPYQGSDSYSLPSSSLGRREQRYSNKMHCSDERCTGTRRKKHFLDENPIAPDYMLEKARGHRSLDENFGRSTDFDSFKYDRKRCVERDPLLRKPKEFSCSTSNKFVRGDRSPSIRSTEEPLNENPTDFTHSQQKNYMNLGLKVECVYSLLSMLGSHDPAETSKKFLELSRSVETCATLRRSGCIPLLVQIMHSDTDEETRRRAAMALHNVVHCNFDDKTARREAKVLRLIEQIMEYCNFLKSLLVEGGETVADDVDRHPLPAVSSLMKVSFDEEHRHAMCQLGALQAIASLVHLDHAAHGASPENQVCNSLRRYALMALTNLTFGDGNNKALLCANKEFMEALVAQLDSAPDDLLQVTASVLRNLSWRADNNMKAVLNEIGTVTALTKAAMKNKNENTLKAILSALWNLSAHCSTNKTELCAVEGALAFLVDMLTYEGPSKTLKIIENAGGILRNVSSHVAVREDFRKILRQKNCLGILLQQLKSESLTVVSNACGTLWNLSARFPEDQKYLWDNGAVPMLRSLIHSKHKMISEGSSAALKNLLNFRPTAISQTNMDPIAKSLGLKELPSLNARKQRALEQELNRNLAETCDNLDNALPPKEKIDSNFSDDTKDQSEISPTTNREPVIPKVDSGVMKQKKPTYSIEKFQGDSKPPATSDQGRSQTFGVRNNFVESGYDIDNETEHPIDYSAKYDTETAAASKVEEVNALPKPIRKGDMRNYAPYQETDLDQLTDFSLRYAENRVDCESGEKVLNPGNEIILILEDTVKCYETEGTPCAISNAASVSDLRNNKIEEPQAVVKNVTPKTEGGQVFAFGTYSPEKPVNYCEEGTPGYYSRYDSFSSLEESPHNYTNTTKIIPDVVEEENLIEETPKEESENMKANDKAKVCSTFVSQSPCSMPNKPSVAINSAQETPLMFSRRSSMDSVASAEPNTADDKSSVVSDFSRLASGAISPSEIPDSPTQSMPQSPRRSNHIETPFSTSAPQSSTSQKPFSQQRLRSVFEDDLSTFRVENTPAQFSCATSLSNLSIDDEPKIPNEVVCKETLPRAETEDAQQSSTKIPEEVKSEKTATGDTCILSDIEEGNDDLILANCISIGMHRGRKKKEQSKPAIASREMNAGEDSTIQYCTEDTPGLSKAASNSNLSALSLCTNKCDTNISDESSNASDSNELLEQCIREGMEKSSALKQREKDGFGHLNLLSKQHKDPIDMLRRGGPSSYLPVKDEMNKFHVEDSPCNFSVLSGLSNLTVGSEIAGLAEMKSLKESEGKFVESIKEREDDSLSSTSIDDMKPLTEAIAAGSSKASLALFTSLNEANNPSTSRMIESFDNMALRELNESISSIDSSDSNDNQAKSLLEQCIRTGMIKDKKIEKITSKSVPSLKTVLPSGVVSSAQKPVRNVLNRQRNRERKDEQILIECINTGISKSVRAEGEPNILSPRDDQIVGDSSDRIQQNVPKNGRTTSAVVPEQTTEECKHPNVPGTAPDVETLNALNDINNEQKSQYPVNLSNITNITGFNKNSIIQHEPYKDVNGVTFEQLDQNTANPAGVGEGVSNGILIPQEILEKHKDPNLMLKSVERLTKELVTQAEILRGNRSFSFSQVSDCNMAEGGSGSGSTSDNTWNEDLCTIDNSFPSVSVVAPTVTSLKDDETTLSDETQTVTDSKSLCEQRSSNGSLSPQNPAEVLQDIQEARQELACSTSIHEEDLFNGGSGIKFQVGQEVNQIDRSCSRLPFLNTASYEIAPIMTDSAIIAMEAKKLANQLLDSNISGSSISLDLDNIRPPSGMEFLSMSGCIEQSRSPQTVQHKKSLLTGIVAKRAIETGHFFMGGSAENLNSGYNLDSIKPPSLMDELLDSMISVASITSEVVDNTIGTRSNYETACNNFDENTLTLHSCTEDFSSNFDSATPEMSEFSSAESTPVKRRGDPGNSDCQKRTFISKERRKAAKDRYRTYTIDVDTSFKKETFVNADLNSGFHVQEDNDEKTYNVYETHTASPIATKSDFMMSPATPEVNCRKKREESSGTIRRRALDPERFKTRTIIFNDSANYAGKLNLPEISADKQTSPEGEIIAQSEPASIQNFVSSSDDLDDENSTASNGANNTIKSKTEICENGELYFANEEFTENEIVDSLPDLQADFQHDPEAERFEVNTKNTLVKKKAAYISPYRKDPALTVNIRAPAPKSNTEQSAGGGAKIVIPVMRKTTNIRPQARETSKPVEKRAMQSVRHTTLDSKNRTDLELGKKNEHSDLPGKCLKKMDSLPALERQGTFVKDEPTNVDVPVISSPPSRVPKLAAKSTTPKYSVQNGSATRLVKKTDLSLQKGTSNLTKANKLAQKPSLTPLSIRNSTAQSTPLSRQKSLEGGKKKTVVGVLQNSNKFFAQRSKSNTTIRTNASTSKTDRPTVSSSRSNLNQASLKNVSSRVSTAWKKSADVRRKSSTFENGPAKEEPKKQNVRPVSEIKQGTQVGMSRLVAPKVLTSRLKEPTALRQTSSRPNLPSNLSSYTGGEQGCQVAG